MSDGYRAYVVLVDERYPMPEESMGGWEAGWWPVGGHVWAPEDLEDAEWFAGYLASVGGYKLRQQPTLGIRWQEEEVGDE